MNILYNILTLNFSHTPLEVSEKILANIANPQNIPKEIYAEIIFANSQHCPGPAVFTELIKALFKSNESTSIIKIITIVFNVIRLTQYDSKFLDSLQHLNSQPLTSIPFQDSIKITEVLISCKSYLIRLPSVSDVLKKALQVQKIATIQFKQYQSDLFRMVNMQGLLFPNINTLFNTVGRYYINEHPYFSDFYQAIRGEVLLSYKYMYFVTDVFIKRYKQCEWTILDCFMKSLPEIQLLCDKIEQFLLNKYFKGKSPSKKIYFKEEQIREISYHLQRTRNQKFAVQRVNTAESEKNIQCPTN